jgi:hypothetical protein
VRFLPTKWCVKLRSKSGGTSNKFYVSLQQFVLLIQQVQAPEDLVTLPQVPSPQTAPTTRPPSPPVNTTNTSPTRTPTNGQTTNASSASLLPNTAQQRLPGQGQGVAWLSVLRFIVQFVWYDEHNRICMPTSPMLLPLLDHEPMTRVLHIHRTRPRRTCHGRTWTWGRLSRLAVRIHLGTADHACCAPWKALCVGKKVCHRDDCGTNVAGNVYAFSFRRATSGRN